MSILSEGALLQEMGLLEVKHGLLQIAETLDFLHNNARLIHRALSPEVITSYFVLSSILKHVEVKICSC